MNPQASTTANEVQITKYTDRMSSSKTPCVDGYVIIKVARDFEYFSACKSVPKYIIFKLK
jgi:hypothetical protein